MQGVILATGRSDSQGRDRVSRVRGFLPLGGRPLIEHIADSLVEAGCGKLVVFSHQAHENLYREDFAVWYSKAAVDVRSLPEADTIHSFWLALNSVGAAEQIFAVTDDEVFDFSLRPMIAERRRCGRAVMALRSADRIPGDVRELNMGFCELDESGRMRLVSSAVYRENDVAPELVVLGMIYMEPEDILRTLALDRTRPAPELIYEFHRALQGLRMDEGFWADVGKPPLYEAALRHYERIAERG